MTGDKPETPIGAARRAIAEHGLGGAVLMLHRTGKLDLIATINERLRRILMKSSKKGSNANDRT